MTLPLDKKLASVMGNLDGGTRDTDNNISDEELFKQPPPYKDCPICLLRLPTHELGIVYKSCCGKMICSGCEYAPVKDHNGKVIIDEKCPFCRTAIPGSADEYNKRLMKRAKLADAEATRSLGHYYSDGLDGFPQDYDKALELFIRAGELGSTKAYNNIGYAYSSGRGVEMDKNKAKYYYELAAIKGCVSARYNLGIYEKRVGNWERALKHYMISAGSGCASSLKEIQKLYASGHAIKDDYTKALRAYQAYLAEIKSVERNKAVIASGDRYY